MFSRLVKDRRLADRLSGAVERLDEVLASAQHGQGPLPALLNDPGDRAKLDEALANLDSASKDLKELTSHFGNSQALLPRLLEDQAYGREITERLRETVEHLDTATDRLVEGKGTAARLINDPAIYDAVNDIIVGVNKSWMLRWLLQNRQKAGIKQRYQDATAGGGGAPLEPQPPQPPRQAPSPPPPPPAEQMQTPPPPSHAPTPSSPRRPGD